MATVYTLHPDTPQARIIEKIRDDLRAGAVMLYPTDTVYAIGCDLESKNAIQRVRKIKELSNDKPLTFLCPSLSNISQYAAVSDVAYRTMRRLIPGPYTFLLPATKLVPKLVMNPKRRTTGIRVPDHTICQAVMAALGNPIISTSAYKMDEDSGKGGRGNPLQESRFELFDSLDKLVDIIIDGKTETGTETSTILDLTEETPVVVRRGLGWEAVVEWVGDSDDY